MVLLNMFYYLWYYPVYFQFLLGFQMCVLKKKTKNGISLTSISPVTSIFRFLHQFSDVFSKYIFFYFQAKTLIIISYHFLRTLIKSRIVQQLKNLFKFNVKVTSVTGKIRMHMYVDLS